MPFPIRIQPIDMIRNDTVRPPAPVLKSRLKRLFDRPFSGVLRISSAAEKDAVFEPSSICLDKMVRNFIEGSSERQPSGGRNRCNCFSGNSHDSSDEDDDLDSPSDSVSPNLSFSDLSDALKSLIPCESIAERNVWAHASKIVENHNKTVKQKDDLRKIVTDGLIALGYDAAVCKSKWEKTPSIPAGDYEYIDVMIQGERVIIDVDFRSEFEIARSTSGYRAILQCLPHIFVGKSERLGKMVSIASEGARLSLKKKGIHIAPWRKYKYAKSKWLSPYTRIKQLHGKPLLGTTEVFESEVGDLDLDFGDDDDDEPKMVWQFPAVKPKRSDKGNKRVVTGLAFLFKEKV